MSAAENGTGKLDWFPFYADRFLGSRKVRRMTAKQVGIYTLLLVEQWSGGPLPDDDEELRLMGKAPAREVRRVLQLCFDQAEDGRWTNAVLEDIRAASIERHERRVAAGRKGGKAQAAARKQLRSNAKAKP